MRTFVLLCSILTTVCLAIKPAEHTTTSDSIGSKVEKSPASFINQLIVRFGGPASYPETRLTSNFDTTGIHDTIVKSLDRPHWYASEPHPFLTNVLPGVSFAVVTYGSWRTGSFMPCAITSDGRVYQNEDLNSLLLTEGFTFDSTELQTIAKIAVLFEYLASPPPGTDTPPERSPLDRVTHAPSQGSLAFPNVVFSSFTRKTTKQPYGAVDTKLTVFCKINGIDETVDVYFHGTPDGASLLWWLSSPHKYLPYQPGRLPEPDPASPSK